MNSAYDKKAIYRDRENIFRFVETFGVGQGKTFFFTLTFSDNITDRKIAGKLWNLMNTKIKKLWNDFKYIAVAERQKRGAWHFHILGHIASLPSLNFFLKYIRCYMSRSKKPFGFCKCTWTYGNSHKGVASYMTKYLQKQDRESGVRYVCYSRNWIRAVILPFSWAYGPARSWRLSCSQLDSTFPGLFRFLYYHSSFNFKISIISAQQAGDFQFCYDLVFKYAIKLFPYLSQQVREVLLYARQNRFLSSSEFAIYEKQKNLAKKEFFDFGKYYSDLPVGAT